MYGLQGFFSKIVLIVRNFRKLYGFPLKMYGFLYGFFQKSFGHQDYSDFKVKFLNDLAKTETVLKLLLGNKNEKIE